MKQFEIQFKTKFVFYKYNKTHNLHTHLKQLLQKLLHMPAAILVSVGLSSKSWVGI